MWKCAGGLEPFSDIWSLNTLEKLAAESDTSSVIRIQPYPNRFKPRHWVQSPKFPDKEMDVLLRSTYVPHRFVSIKALCLLKIFNYTSYGLLQIVSVPSLVILTAQRPL